MKRSQGKLNCQLRCLTAVLTSFCIGACALKFEKLLQLIEPNLSLHGAVASGDVALVKHMLEDGADPHAEDEQVCTIAVPHAFIVN